MALYGSDPAQYYAQQQQLQQQKMAQMINMFMQMQQMKQQKQQQGIENQQQQQMMGVRERGLGIDKQRADAYAQAVAQQGKPNLLTPEQITQQKDIYRYQQRMQQKFAPPQSVPYTQTPEYKQEKADIDLARTSEKRRTQDERRIGGLMTRMRTDRDRYVRRAQSISDKLNTGKITDKKVLAGMQNEYAELSKYIENIDAIGNVIGPMITSSADRPMGGGSTDLFNHLTRNYKKIEQGTAMEGFKSGDVSMGGAAQAEDVDEFGFSIGQTRLDSTGASWKYTGKNQWAKVK